VIALYVQRRVIVAVWARCHSVDSFTKASLC
jgi:hypothetical protein